jgi:hypothetical protein
MIDRAAMGFVPGITVCLGVGSLYCALVLAAVLMRYPSSGISTRENCVVADAKEVDHIALLAGTGARSSTQTSQHCACTQFASASPAMPAPQITILNDMRRMRVPIAHHDRIQVMCRVSPGWSPRVIGASKCDKIIIQMPGHALGV